MSAQLRPTKSGLPLFQSIRDGWNALIGWLDNTHVLGKSLLWYVSGWRLGIIALVLAIIYPQEFDDSYVLAGIGIGIYVLLALGLNIVVGYAGLLDLGYVAFFVIGSYTYAALSIGFLYNSSKQIVPAPIISFWWLLPLGPLLAGIAGVLLGAPTLRLRGDYLAIVTLGFGEIARIVILNVPYFGSANGLNPNPAPKVTTPLGEVNFGNFADHSAFYYLTLGAVVIVVLLVSLLRNSSLGRAWVAMREDETAASTSGVNLVRTKLLAFATGAARGAPRIARANDPRLVPFRKAFNAVLANLAEQVARDGEGARKLVEIVVEGAVSKLSARRVALSIANSPLVKTAIAGEDANWGRVVMAVGKAGEPADRDRLSIWFGGIRVAHKGARDPDYDEAAVSAAMKKPEITLKVALGLGKGRDRVLTCDLTKEYVAINGDYRS